MPAAIPEKAAAIAAGETTYLTGKPCKYGHIGPRFVSGGQCVACNNAHSKAGRTANPERHAAYQRSARTQDPSKNREAVKRYRTNHPERYRDMVRRWKIKNYEHYLDRARVLSGIRQARKRQNGGRFTKADITALREKQQDLCAHCGVHNERLEIDHIVPIALGGSSNPANLQLLCRSCNSRKGARQIG